MMSSQSLGIVKTSPWNQLSHNRQETCGVPRERQGMRSAGILTFIGFKNFSMLDRFSTVTCHHVRLNSLEHTPILFDDLLVCLYGSGRLVERQLMRGPGNAREKRFHEAPRNHKQGRQSTISTTAVSPDFASTSKSMYWRMGPPLLIPKARITYAPGETGNRA